MTTPLDRAGVSSVETLVRRILRTFDVATHPDLEAGATWYGEAQALAVDLATAGNIDVTNAAVIIAHLSPRTPWSRNVMGATVMIREGRRARSILEANYLRAVKSLEYVDPFDSFGPKSLKTRAFAANILGDTEAVTVDVWAARVAGITEQQLSLKGVYDLVAHAYRLAARRRGVTPATMQATTWVVARNGRAS